MNKKRIKRELTEEEFNELLKVIPFEELYFITTNDRDLEKERFYKKAVKYKIINKDNEEEPNNESTGQ